MIKIKQIKEEPCYLYYKDELIGEIKEELQLLDVRIQLSREQDVENYKIKFQNRFYNFDNDCDLKERPYDLFNKQIELLEECMMIGFEKLENQNG